MSPSYRIVFYVSGHGFGHTSRTIAVIDAVAERRPGVEIAVRTSAPRRLFERPDKVAAGLSRTPPIEFFDVQTDTAAGTAIDFKGGAGVVRIGNTRSDQ